MIGYTSAIPNRSCLKILNRSWRLLLSPASVRSVTKKNRHILFQRGYAIDNGAYAWFNKDMDFQDDKFLALCDEYHKEADWIVIPDYVGDWWETARMFMLWYPRLIKYRKKLMFVAQDGIEKNNYATVKGMTSNGVGIFVGGSTEWKINNGRNIAKICKDNNELCHIGRVNTAKRLKLCFDWGATSFDGSGMSRFSQTAVIMNREMCQGRLF